jgi:hypothetical protein
VSQIVDAHQRILFCGRIATDVHQELTLHNAPGGIQLEQGNRGTTYGSQPDDPGPFKSKVLLPRLRARIEERNDRAVNRINCRQVGAFTPIAFQASEREVVASRVAAMFEGDNVINMMGKGDILLMKQAILAPLPCALHDAPPQRCGDVD